MRGINKAIIVGTVGQDPELRAAGNGVAVINVSVATSETWKDKQTGEPVEKTTWHRIVMFGRLAEIAGKFLKKGSQAYFEGRLQVRDYEKDGVKTYVTEIVANEMQMLGGKGERSAGGNVAVPTPTTQPNSGGGDDGFDAIPFAPIDWRAS